MAILRRNILGILLLGLLTGILFIPAFGEPSQARVRDLIIHAGDVPRRLVGYGLVVGLEGTGDRSFGGIASQNATVHSVVNLLRKFNLEVPSDYLRLRNVAAVLVTAEVSPYLRAGGRFEVQVSALGDATSLQGGVLWITPLVTDPSQPAVATAQGTILVTEEDLGSTYYVSRSNSGRIPDGGVLEVDPPPVAAQPRLLLRKPDRLLARSIVDAINGALGDGSAEVEDPGSIRLTVAQESAGEFYAAVDTITVQVQGPARVVIHGREGTVVAGGEVRLGSAVIHHRGITLQIGGEAAAGAGLPGLVRVTPSALVQDVAAGLHAAGAQPDEIAAIFEALRDAGALNAEVVIR
jgi:flagellar P-ring protein precursor FlgI